MTRKTDIDSLSVAELEQLLYRKKRRHRQERLERLRREGRLVELSQMPLAEDTAANELETETAETAVLPPESPSKRSPLVNRLLLFVEIGAVLGLAYVLVTLWTTRQSLNQELADVQRAEAQSLALPTPTPRPLINVAILPTGHTYVEGGAPLPVESGDIPEHLLPVINAYQPPPPPQAAPEHARRIQIPAIGVDSTIVADAYNWEQLKKGVGHHIGSAQPGQNGNMVLAAHNDIYGAIFRYLDQLSPGDEIIVSTELTSYTYVVNDIQVVDPIDGLWVMDQTDHAQVTLISCYPYQINTERIVVFADLVTEQATN